MNRLSGMDMIRVFFYLLVLAGLIVVYVKSGGDPCVRCSLKIDSLNETMNCRELINRTIAPFIDNYNSLPSTYSNMSINLR